MFLHKTIMWKKSRSSLNRNSIGERSHLIRPPFHGKFNVQMQLQERKKRVYQNRHLKSPSGGVSEWVRCKALRARTKERTVAASQREQASPQHNSNSVWFCIRLALRFVTVFESRKAVQTESRAKLAWALPRCSLLSVKPWQGPVPGRKKCS